jgi:hypothetical protein
MNEAIRKQEQLQYDIANNWLKANGKLEIFLFKDLAKLKIVFTKNESSTELIGEDVVLLTLQLYNEVKD